MSDSDDNTDVQRVTCLRAQNKLLFRLVEGQWIFVPKNELEATALNSLCTAVDIAFNDLSTICHYLKLVQTKKLGSKELVLVPVEKWEQLKGQLFDMFGDSHDFAVSKEKDVRHDKGRSDFVFLRRGSLDLDSHPIPVWADSSVARREFHSMKRPFTPGYARAKQGPETQKKIKLICDSLRSLTAAAASMTLKPVDESIGNATESTADVSSSTTSDPIHLSITAVAAIDDSHRTAAAVGFAAMTTMDDESFTQAYYDDESSIDSNVSATASVADRLSAPALDDMSAFQQAHGDESSTSTVAPPATTAEEESTPSRTVPRANPPPAASTTALVRPDPLVRQPEWQPPPLMVSVENGEFDFDARIGPNDEF
jgi:hypothetical protein